MIHYQLQCSASHPFDGWFRDSAAYEEQASRGLLECPTCGETQVARALMAPALARKGRRVPTPPATAPSPDTPPTTPVASVGGERLPDGLRAMLQRLRSEVERNCDYVGPQFAAEARRIHDGETEPRSIYGEATPDEAEALAEDGIDVARIPWLPRSDA